MSELLQIMRERKSIRTFDGNPLSAADRERLERYIETISNPFGIRVCFILLDAKEKGLSSPVISGETLYVAGKISKESNADVAFGYSFEKLVLYAWSLGVGTTWIGGTMKRDLFETAAGLSDSEMMPCVSPLGYPAKRRSVKETLMRKAIGADSRMPSEKLFFDSVWERPLPTEKQAGIADLIEMVRWAPSAVNKQPCRIVAEGNRYHFYVKHDKGYVNEKTGDLQKIDVGIALCHFVMGLEECGFKPEVEIEEPEIAVPDNAEYIVTVKYGKEQINNP